MQVLKTRLWPLVVRVARSPAAWCFAICRVAALALLAISALIGLSAMSVFGVGPRPLISIPICTWLFNGSFELMRGLSFGARAALARHGVHLLVPPGDWRSSRAS